MYSYIHCFIYTHITSSLWCVQDTACCDRNSGLDLWSIWSLCSIRSSIALFSRKRRDSFLPLKDATKLFHTGLVILHVGSGVAKYIFFVHKIPNRTSLCLNTWQFRSPTYLINTEINVLISLSIYHEHGKK